MATPPLQGVYLVADLEALQGRDLLAVVAAALRGGLCAVQLRAKKTTVRAFVQAAQALLPIVAAGGVQLYVNDSLIVALAAGAQGLHIGQGDVGYVEARKAAGPDMLIGLSVENAGQLAIANALEGLAYVGVGPIFSTPTKPDAAPALGLEGLASLARQSRHPVVAIGGINKTNARQVYQAGAQAIAVVSAICQAQEPELATRALQR